MCPITTSGNGGAGEEVLPEGLFWLLCTGDLPTQAQADALSQEWIDRAAIPNHVIQMLNNFPANLHPMSQFSCAITALNSESKFAKAYADGVKKTQYWEVGTATVHWLVILAVSEGCGEGALGNLQGSMRRQ